MPLLQRHASYLPTRTSPHLGAFSARLVAISPETPDASLTTQEKAELTYTVLSDTSAQLASSLGITLQPSEDGLAAQRQLGVDIRTTRADDGTILPMPTVLIVDRNHVLRFVDIHPDYTGRTRSTTFSPLSKRSQADEDASRSLQPRKGDVTPPSSTGSLDWLALQYCVG